MKYVSAIVVIISLCLLNACGTRTNDPVVLSAETVNQTLAAAIDTAVLPAVEEFADQSAMLSAAATDFCASTNAANLTTLQQQWRTLSERWYHLGNYNFGPLNDNILLPRYSYIDSLRPNGRDYTDSVRNAITADINGSHMLDSAYFANKTFNLTGLLALEIALFETADSGHAQDMTALVNEYHTRPRKCAMLQGLAKHLETTAIAVQDGWNINYNGTGESYRTRFLNNQLDDGTPPLTRLLSALQEHLDYLKKRSVATRGAQISGYGWENLAAALAEVEGLLEGSGVAAASPAAESSQSFLSLLEAAGHPQSAALVRTNIEEAKASIEAHDSNRLGLALGLLDGNFKREIPEGLNVDLGLNFTDGD